MRCGGGAFTYQFLSMLGFDLDEKLSVNGYVMSLIDQFLCVSLDIPASLLYVNLYCLDLPGLVLFLLADDLLLRDHVVLVPPESLDLARELLHLKLHLLLLELYVVRLLMLHLLELGQVAHQPVVLVLVELQLLLLRLVRALLLLQLHRVLVHRVPVQELLRARQADEPASLTRRVVHRVRTRLVQARTAVQGTAELTR